MDYAGNDPLRTVHSGCGIGGAAAEWLRTAWAASRCKSAMCAGLRCPVAAQRTSTALSLGRAGASSRGVAVVGGMASIPPTDLAPKQFHPVGSRTQAPGRPHKKVRVRGLRERDRIG